MRKNQVQRHLSLRCKIKADHVELCIIDNTTGAIQYECVPINFDVIDNVKEKEESQEVETSVEEGGKE